MYLAGWIVAGLLVGVVAGWVTNQIIRNPGHGIYLDIGIGVVGALLGAAAASLDGISSVDRPVHMMAGELAGAVIFTALIRRVIRKKR